MKDFMLNEATEGQAIFPMNFLQSSQEELYAFLYAGDMGNSPVLTNLFGGVQLKSLVEIGIACMGNKRFHMLAATNFSGLPVVRAIALSDCGIEYIQSDTFDRIADTLTAFLLVGNPLLRLTINSFRIYLDKRLESAKAKSLFFYQDEVQPYDCSMDFYRLRNATMIAFHYDVQKFIQMFCKSVDHGLEENDKKQPPQQVLHPKRWGLSHAGVAIYTFPKFLIHFIPANRTLRIVQFDQNDHYRLFIWTIRDSTSAKQDKCLPSTWMHTNVQCRWCNRTIEFINITQFDNGIAIAACVIHISMRKQSVPVHCHTIRLALNTAMIETSGDFTFNWLYFGIGLAIGIAILTAIALFLICKKPAPASTTAVAQ